MIRPRGGDFTYSDFEFETMVASLIAFWDAGADGFVFRILTADGLIDEERNKRLLALAGAKPCTFHRAFDGVGDKNAGLEVLVRVGFAGVLTSGIGGGGAVDGKKMLRELVGRADGRIEVIPGGGVRSANLGGLVDCVGARWWHASAVVEGEEASEEELRALRALLNEKLL